MLWVKCVFVHNYVYNVHQLRKYELYVFTLAFVYLLGKVMMSMFLQFSFIQQIGECLTSEPLPTGRWAGQGWGLGGGVMIPPPSSFSICLFHSLLLHKSSSPFSPPPLPFIAASSMIISGIGVLLIWVLPSVDYITVLLSCIFSGFSIIGWNALDVLSVELFPTHLRYTLLEAMMVCSSFLIRALQCMDLSNETTI